MVGLAVVIYWTCAIAFCSMTTTSAGSLAYESASTMLWPSVSIHSRKSVSAFFFIGSSILEGISSHVKLEIGYASGPVESVIDTLMSSGICLEAPAAAAEIGRAHV